MFHSNVTSENKTEKVKKDGNSARIYANFQLKAKHLPFKKKKGRLFVRALKSQFTRSKYPTRGI